MAAYKFSDTARREKPDNDRTKLLDKAMSQQKLTRREKDDIAGMLYGILGAMSSTYKLAGWAWPMHQVLPRILVSFTYEKGVFHSYYAPDKTSLRKVLSDVSEMVYA